MTVRFSVFIPVRNDRRWLPGAIDSVLRQTHAAWEPVVGDNASSEDLGEIVGRYADPPIRYHRWPVAVPPADNFNRTLTLCKFEWLQMLVGRRPSCGALSRSAGGPHRGTARTPPRIALALTACRRTDELGRPAEIRYYRSRPVNVIEDGRYDAAGWLRVTARSGSLPWNIGWLALNRDVLSEVGGFYRGEIGLCADVEMATRAAARCCLHRRATP